MLIKIHIIIPPFNTMVRVFKSCSNTSETIVWLTAVVWSNYPSINSIYEKQFADCFRIVVKYIGLFQRYRSLVNPVILVSPCFIERTTFYIFLLGNDVNL